MKLLIALAFQVFIILNITAQSDLNDDIDFFLIKHVKEGAIDYEAVKYDPMLKEIVGEIASLDISDYTNDQRLCFYVNAYNLLAIDLVLQSYPTSSVQDISGFFDRRKVNVAGNDWSLNTLEKDQIFQLSSDPRLHFALVCAAKGCPRIRPYAYRVATFDQQLDTSASLALKEPNTISIDQQQMVVHHSKIFSWYKSDFNKSSDVRSFIEKYIDTDLAAYKFKELNYDWSLNDYKPQVGDSQLANNSFRYVSSATVPKGGVELKVFNNLYSQNDNFQRSSFFTMINSFLYGYSSNLNVGFDIRYRRVHNGVTDRSPFAVLGNVSQQGRQGVTTIGPKIRWAPLPRLFPNFSVQSAFWFATGDELQGNSDLPFIDWSSHTWITQLFNDKTIGDKFSVFTELDFILEDMGSGENNQFSTPGTVILSYFPLPNVTLYGLGGYSPFWSSEYNYFYQVGAGARYQIHPNLEFELLYTHFNNKFLRSVDGGAATYNLGIRYSRN